MRDQLFWILVILSLPINQHVLAQGQGRAGQLRGQIGSAVEKDVFTLYERGLAYLTSQQDARGTWDGGEGNGPGTTALAVLAFLASGEDPNFGPYRDTIRRGIRHIIAAQSPQTGYIGPSMYHHGFASLALAEAYGAVDDDEYFSAQEENGRSIEEALELATRATLTAQKRNRRGGWRYSPVANDADTSVSGTVMISLLAARNAGMKVPDRSIDRAIEYFVSMTLPDGSVAYSAAGDSGGDSIARSSIVNLVLSIARRRDLPAFDQSKRYLVLNQDSDSLWPEYSRYYLAQALFQVDADLWQRWNDQLVKKLKSAQQPDGHFEGELGDVNSTSMSLLALAVNFRFLPIYER
ncbi:MAG: prenyltransferase/squalene oxidase repeat-containing protein [Planctomycetota bacterium]